MSGAVETEQGRIMVVTRHPRAGREIEAFGGARRFRGKDVLDVGTGDGRLAFDLARYARRVVGLDPSTENLRAAREEADRRDVRNIDFVLGTAQELALGRERFDIAIFSWSL